MARRAFSISVRASSSASRSFWISLFSRWVTMCGELNAMETVFSGIDLRLEFALVGPVKFHGVRSPEIRKIVRRRLTNTGRLNVSQPSTEKEIEHFVAGWQSQVPGDLPFEKTAER